MKSTGKLTIYNIVIYSFFLSLLFVCGSCSSRNDEQNKDEQKKEVANVKSENNDLKESLPQAIDKTKGPTVQASLDDADKQKSLKRYEEQVKAVLEGLDSKINPEQKIDLITSLDELAIEQDPAMIDIVSKALSDPEPEVGRAAIELLEDYETTKIFPVIKQALASKDELIRINALLPLANIKDPRVKELLAGALNDTSEDVRAAALEVTVDCDDSIQLHVLGKGMSSSYKDVKVETLLLLESKGDHGAIEIIIKGLEDADPEFREQVNLTLNFLIDKEFKTYKEAKSWWNRNKSQYDEDLFEMDD